VNTFISRWIWGTWLICGMLISASLDSVPDFPAVIKQARASQAFQSASHFDSASRAHDTVPAGVIPASPPALHWQSFPSRFESVLSPGSLRFCILRASDSSPPLYRT